MVQYAVFSGGKDRDGEHGQSRRDNHDGNEKQIVITAQATAFIYDQPLAVITRFMALIKTIETDGRLVPPDGKKVDSDLFEMRVKSEGNQYRVFYCYAVGNLVYVLNGFVKKTPKAPKQEIRKAHAIMKGLGL